MTTEKDLKRYCNTSKVLQAARFFCFLTLWRTGTFTLDSYLECVLLRCSFTLQQKPTQSKVQPADDHLSQLGKSLKKCLNMTHKLVT